MPLAGWGGWAEVRTGEGVVPRCTNHSFSMLKCSQIENVNKVIERVAGVAKSPYSPHANITALMTAGGQYFVGSPTDFSGTDSAITRTDGHPNSQSLRTDQYNSKWLNEPHFVGSFETEKFVFFLFREAAVEYINCGKVPPPFPPAGRRSAHAHFVHFFR